MGLVTTLILSVVIALLLTTLYGAFWRLYLSPIAKFPGPKIAALTFWYECYYNVVKGGAYAYEVERMHQRYGQGRRTVGRVPADEIGPIVRINPYELSVNDTDLGFMNRLYPSVGKEVDKFWWLTGMFGNNEMTFGAIHHDLHKIRRAAFRKMFSSTSIRRLELTLKKLVNSIIEKITERINACEQVNLVHAYSALTQHVITEYCFANSRNMLQKPGFAPQYYEWMQVHCTFTPVIKQFTWLLPMLNKLPDWFVKVTNDAVWLIRIQEAEYIKMARGIINGGDDDKTSHVTVFHDIFNEPSLSFSQKTEHLMMAEAESLVGAGTLTSAHMLSLTSYFVLANPRILEKLAAELSEAMPDPASSPSIQAFESLPYLNAVIDKGFRMSYGSMHRLSRSHPDDSLKYGDWVITPGTPVGYSAYLVHNNPKLFPEPQRFNPEGWTELEPNERQHLRSHLNMFGRGTRQCAEMRLAYADIYLMLGYLFRRLGQCMQLYETEYKRDIEYVQDYFIPATRPHSRGCRVTAKA